MRAIARAATASSPGSRARTVATGKEIGGASHASDGQKNQMNQENRLTEAAYERKSVGDDGRVRGWTKKSRRNAVEVEYGTRLFF
jgi:hypothetical protein